MHFYALILLCCLVLFQACTTAKAPIPNLNKLHFNNPIPAEIASVNQRINNHLLEVEITLKSSSQYFKEVIAYKIEWYDKDGFVLKNLQQNNYKKVVIEPKRDLVIKELATDNRAVDFVIYIENLNQRSIS